jgi:hypothetical protein
MSHISLMMIMSVLQQLHLPTNRSVTVTVAAPHFPAAHPPACLPPACLPACVQGLEGLLYDVKELNPAPVPCVDLRHMGPMRLSRFWSAVHDALLYADPRAAAGGRVSHLSISSQVVCSPRSCPPSISAAAAAAASAAVHECAHTRLLLSPLPQTAVNLASTIGHYLPMSQACLLLCCCAPDPCSCCCAVLCCCFSGPQAAVKLASTMGHYLSALTLDSAAARDVAGSQAQGAPSTAESTAGEVPWSVLLVLLSGTQHGD